VPLCLSTDVPVSVLVEPVVPSDRKSETPPPEIVTFKAPPPGVSGSKDVDEKFGEPMVSWLVWPVVRVVRLGVVVDVLEPTETELSLPAPRALGGLWAPPPPPPPPQARCPVRASLLRAPPISPRPGRRAAPPPPPPP